MTASLWKDAYVPSAMATLRNTCLSIMKMLLFGLTTANDTIRSGNMDAADMAKRSELSR